MFFIYILEIVGTIAFSISGALVAMKKKLDFFGVIVLSITTALGGGIIRDLILGKTPPTAFVEFEYLLIAIVAAILVMLLYKRIGIIKHLILIADAFGLAVFSVIGVEAAKTFCGYNIFLMISMGIMTGIGGGTVRDVFANQIPLVFRKEIYAIASLVGSSIFVILIPYMPDVLAMYISMIFIVGIRLFAIKKNIHLPILDIEKHKQNGYFD